MIAVPYHLGERGVAVGRGPLVLVEALGRPCTILEGTGGVAGINAQLAQEVASQERPVIVLAGNCNSCLGTLSALADPGVVWLDAHGDFNTPETSISGAIEGMSLAIATGHCHPKLMARPVREENVVLGATRSLDPLEEVRLRASQVELASLVALPAAIENLARRVTSIYLHIDLDVLDPAISPGVNFSEPGGITPEELCELVKRVMATGKLAAAAITNFNPDRDAEGRTARIATELVEILEN